MVICGLLLFFPYSYDIAVCLFLFLFSYDVRNFHAVVAVN